MKIAWVSNSYMQPTGYGTVCRNLVPILQKETNHQFVHFAISGKEREMPHTDPSWSEEIPIYAKSSQGGTFGEGDWKVVEKKEDIDLFLLNFDCWGVSRVFNKLDSDLRYSIYPPVDNDPMSPMWNIPMQYALDVVPYCKFGKRVIEEGSVDNDKVSDYIYHGVDTDTFHPKEVSKKEVFEKAAKRELDIDEDTFVVGLLKNNQGTRWAPARHFRAFRQFMQKMQDVNPDQKLLLYVHSSVQGKNGFNLDALKQVLGLENNLLTVDSGDYRFGLDDEDLNDIYNAVDVTLNCTAGEGFGLPILESMAAGTSVIATGFSSMPELLNDKEGELKQSNFPNASFIKAKRGWLVPAWDIEATSRKYSFRRVCKAEHIADALLDANQNPERIDEQELVDYAEQYTWKKIAEQWEEYFDNLEKRMFEQDEDQDDVKWGEISKEKGGVGAFKK